MKLSKIFGSMILLLVIVFGMFVYFINISANTIGLDAVSLEPSINAISSNYIWHKVDYTKISGIDVHSYRIDTYSSGGSVYILLNGLSSESGCGYVRCTTILYWVNANNQAVELVRGSGISYISDLDHQDAMVPFYEDRKGNIFAMINNTIYLIHEGVIAGRINRVKYPAMFSDLNGTYLVDPWGGGYPTGATEKLLIP